MQHVDLISASPLETIAWLLEIITDMDDPKAKRDGTYVYASLPHEEEECKFKDAPLLDGRRVIMAKDLRGAYGSEV